MAVAYASTCSSDSALSLGTSTCHTYGPKKKKTEKKNERKGKFPNSFTIADRHPLISSYDVIRIDLRNMDAEIKTQILDYRIP